MKMNNHASLSIYFKDARYAKCQILLRLYVEKLTFVGLLKKQNMRRKLLGGNKKGCISL